MNQSHAIEQVSASLFAVNRDLENPKKDAKGQVRGRSDYRYLSLPALIDHVRPLLTKYQLYVTQEVTGGAGFVEVRTTVWHHVGQFLEFGPVFIRYEGDAQQAGSAITYARRYGLSAVFNLAADEDDDAAAVSGRRAAESSPSLPAATPPGPAPQVTTGEGTTDTNGGGPATATQWERLLNSVGGSRTKALSRLNMANKTGYKLGDMDKATVDQVAAAIVGGTE